MAEPATSVVPQYTDPQKQGITTEDSIIATQIKCLLYQKNRTLKGITKWYGRTLVKRETLDGDDGAQWEVLQMDVGLHQHCAKVWIRAGGTLEKKHCSKTQNCLKSPGCTADTFSTIPFWPQTMGTGTGKSFSNYKYRCRWACSSKMGLSHHVCTQEGRKSSILSWSSPIECCYSLG